jgi:hypothetical protein
VAGCCEYDDDLTGSGATELVSLVNPRSRNTSMQADKLDTGPTAGVTDVRVFTGRSERTDAQR